MSAWTQPALYFWPGRFFLLNTALSRAAISSCVSEHDKACPCQTPPGSSEKRLQLARLGLKAALEEEGAGQGDGGDDNRATNDSPVRRLHAAVLVRLVSQLEQQVGAHRPLQLAWRCT